ncbi:Mitochondrial fission process protein 1 [Trichoplax sp. H2]|uniref:Mitochondrial fission process protein 1 n=1 Tax=Trichoplax adhaerens TaxID=10228 RepID=B3RYX1_TRIAD|nr:hypothetical protein TRIADDRAFT_57245 [Trichoplax adhaerens]EDV24099.1 hypothetical protein TRIADDRAFT_57245 [Trichoplax adhaerens]RDD40703.1 Mitochondrial fission process protein 1 [Trichoplax sp. H2]|eukprot:XP_002113625.1 hypothetical protein TRIADDRAFT_57245 [Trichoplax adhaerens]
MEKREEVTSTVDIYRHTPLRYLGYANEVGEAFRGAIPVRYVKLSYMIAGGYVLADTCNKSSLTSDRFKFKSEHDYQVASKFTETLIWQSLASVIIPGFVINRCCAAFNSFFKLLHVRNRQVMTTALGLALIPIIIKPIDRSVDHVMDSYITPETQRFLAALYHEKTDYQSYALAEAVMHDYNF